MEQIYSTGEIAKLLGIQRHRIEYAIATGHIAEARFRFLDKRVFDAEDVKRMAEHFGVQVDADSHLGGGAGS
jgi:hypothetical protein